MISRRSNTYPRRVILTSGDVFIDRKPLHLSRVPYFRTLYLRRGQWVPLAVLMDNTGQIRERAVDTLRRLAVELPAGFTLDHKREPVFDSPNPDKEQFHVYYRLTTPEVLPPPERTGKAVLPDTDWDEVPLEEADASQ